MAERLHHPVTRQLLEPRFEQETHTLSEVSFHCAVAEQDEQQHDERRHHYPYGALDAALDAARDHERRRSEKYRVPEPGSKRV